MPTHQDVSPEVQAELQAMLKEYEWLLKTQIVKVFKQVDGVLRDCCCRLPLPSKQGEFGSSVKNLGLTPEKFTLSSRNNDAVRCVLTLMGDNIVQAEVEIRYAKAPGHMFRSVAQPDVQWKLQQIQDVANYIESALESVNTAVKRVANIVANELTERKAIQLGDEVMRVTQNVGQVIKELEQARSCLTMPKKRSLTELMEYHPNKCFNPALPPDLPLSFYVSSNKLMCAAYHLQPSANTGGKQTFVVHQGECQVQWLTDVLGQLALGLTLTQQLHDKLQVFTMCSDLHLSQQPTLDSSNVSADSNMLYKM